MVLTPPAAPASNVLIAATTVRLIGQLDAAVVTAPLASATAGVITPSDEPGLKPNQPKKRMIVPNTPIGILWPGMVLALPSLLNLPIRGPSTIATASPPAPPVMWTTPEPAKSTAPLPRPTERPRLASQPPPQTQLPAIG